MITLDGSQGGGQLLRTALSLSAVTQQAFTIKNIRGQREEQGLKPQHLTAVQAVQHLCHADVIGAQLGSKEITFIPHRVEGGTFHFDIGTAGSTTLLLQTLIPACLREDQPTTITVQGGTDTLWCPPSMHFQHVFLEALQRIGITLSLEIKRYGFYPKGGGEMRLTLYPFDGFQPIHFVERGSLERLKIYSLASDHLQQKQVAERMAQEFQKLLPESMAVVHYVKTLSPGCLLHSVAQFHKYAVGEGLLGDVRLSAENVGKTVALKTQTLLLQQGVDGYLGDQLMLYMAMAGKGEVLVPAITDHMRTNAAVIEQFLPVKFTFEKNLIACRKKLFI